LRFDFWHDQRAGERRDNAGAIKVNHQQLLLDDSCARPKAALHSASSKMVEISAMIWSSSSFFQCSASALVAACS
jgi:hypothetical protein